MFLRRYWAVRIDSLGPIVPDIHDPHPGQLRRHRRPGQHSAQTRRNNGRPRQVEAAALELALSLSGGPEAELEARELGRDYLQIC